MSIVVFFFFHAIVATLADSVEIPPKTVSSFDIAKFMGRWYLTHTSIIPDLKYYKNGYCVTFDFKTALSDDSFDFLATQVKGSPAGEFSKWEATAILKDKAEPGKWVLDQKDGRDRDFMITDENFWIIRLGPENVETNQYDYAVISVPMGQQLFILARDVKEFRVKYQSSLLVSLYDQGFSTIINKPVETYQELDCKYVQLPAANTTVETLYALVQEILKLVDKIKATITTGAQ